jgi:O-antigen/teichoic acid export membrane protein
MRSHRTVIKGGLSLGSGQIIVQGCSFVRSVIVARLISVEDYGVAAAFAMTLSLLEMISNLSFDKLLVQAPDGNEEEFQKTAQLVQVTRGLINGLILFALAGLIARLFGIPQAVWGFRCLALLPVLRGFLHLDANRMQREMRFGPAVRIDVLSNVLVTLVAWPLAAWFRNYYAMLVLLLMQVAVATVVSQLVAERRYGWSWDRRYARRMFSFGWPLLVNGLLLYGIMQGDRVIIGSARQLFPHAIYTLKDLGEYSIAFSVMMAPAMFVTNVSTSLFLPVLSQARVLQGHFERTYVRVFCTICLGGALISTPFMFAGPRVIIWIYGTKYAVASGIIVWLAGMWGIRMIRTAPTLAALAIADTQTVMFTNVVRFVAVPAVLYAAATGKSLVWVAASGCFGELVALIALIWRLRALHGLQSHSHLRPLLSVGLAMLGAVSMSAVGLVLSNPLMFPIGISVTVALPLITMIVMNPSLRRDLRAVATLVLQGRPRAFTDLQSGT